jgi:hypothetical protein
MLTFGKCTIVWEPLFSVLIEELYVNTIRVIRLCVRTKTRNDHFLPDPYHLQVVPRNLIDTLSASHL